jgi:hypothetical protein
VRRGAVKSTSTASSPAAESGPTDNKALATGEVQTHLAEVYGTEVSRETVSKIIDAALGEINEWMCRR